MLLSYCMHVMLCYVSNILDTVMLLSYCMHVMSVTDAWLDNLPESDFKRPYLCTESEFCQTVWVPGPSGIGKFFPEMALKNSDFWFWGWLKALLKSNSNGFGAPMLNHINRKSVTETVTRVTVSVTDLRFIWLSIGAPNPLLLDLRRAFSHPQNQKSEFFNAISGKNFPIPDGPGTQTVWQNSDSVQRYGLLKSDSGKLSNQASVTDITCMQYDNNITVSNMLLT